jgi:hypothetical protein
MHSPTIWLDARSRMIWTANAGVGQKRKFVLLHPAGALFAAVG